MKWIVSFLAIAIVTGCTTTKREVVTRPDGTLATNIVKVPDKVKTEQVKDVSEAVVKVAMRRALQQFPNEAENIALYARAAGGVFCDMKATGKFSPETLEAGIYALVLPEITNKEALTYLQDARDLMLLTYRSFWRQRFEAELNPDKWPAVVAEIFCDSIDQGLKDSGRIGVK